MASPEITFANWSSFFKGDHDCRGDGPMRESSQQSFDNRLSTNIHDQLGPSYLTTESGGWNDLQKATWWLLGVNLG